MTGCEAFVCLPCDGEPALPPYLPYKGSREGVRPGRSECRARPTQGEDEKLSSTPRRGGRPGAPHGARRRAPAGLRGSMPVLSRELEVGGNVYGMYWTSYSENLTLHG